MSNIYVLLCSILMFALVSRQLGKEIMSKKHRFPFRTGYSHAALMIERTYKFMAYGVLLVLFAYALVISFIQVFAGEPF